MRIRAKSARLFSCVVLALLVSGCARVTPWQRAKLAHPTMAISHGEGPGVEHLRGVTEGAVGGPNGAGSGCGCN